MIRRGELVFVAVLLVFSAAALWQAYSIAGFDKWSSPGIFPMLASGTMLICALFITRDTIRKKRTQHQSAVQEYQQRAVDAASRQTSLAVTSYDKRQISESTRAKTDGAYQSSVNEGAIFPTQVVVMTIALILYILAMPALGFLLDSFLFLFACISYLWKRPLWMSLLVSVASLLIIQIVFRQVFQVILPYGTLLELFR